MYRPRHQSLYRDNNRQGPVIQLQTSIALDRLILASCSTQFYMYCLCMMQGGVRIGDIAASDRDKLSCRRQSWPVMNIDRPGAGRNTIFNVGDRSSHLRVPGTIRHDIIEHVDNGTIIITITGMDMSRVSTV